MKNLKLIVLLVVVSLSASAQLPDADLWIMDLTINGETVEVSSAKNITNNKGYDSQPAFTPDGSYVLFSSVRTNDQSDIYRYDVKTEKVAPFFTTSESEYSPVVAPDKKHISCVQVEKDSSQRIWAFPVLGGLPHVIMPQIDSIGYYTWINEDSLLIFVLTKPFTLQVVDVKSQHAKVITQNPGRCFPRVPGKNEISFIHKNNDTTCVMHSMSLHDLTTKEVMLCNGACNLGKTEDYVWLSSDRFMYAVENKLYVNDRKVGRKLVGDLNALGIKAITRLAVSPDKKRLVIAAQ